MIWNWLGPRKGRTQPAFESELSVDQKALIQDHALPAIRLQAGGSGFSRIGGLPDMSVGMEWPVDPAGKPMSFLAQIDLEAAHSVGADIGLPAKGCLWFFAAEKYYELCGRVLFSDHQATICTETWLPPGLTKSYPPVSVSLTAIDTYPDLDWPSIVGIEGRGKDLELYMERLTDGVEKRHIMGGHCFSIHGDDMPLQFELEARGIAYEGVHPNPSPEFAAAR